MGIATGIAWIIIGVCYIVYKYLNEKCGLEKSGSMILILAGWVVFLVFGTLVIKAETLALSIVLALLIWLICIMVRSLVKELRQNKTNDHENIGEDDSFR